MMEKGRGDQTCLLSLSILDSAKEAVSKKVTFPTGSLDTIHKIDSFLKNTVQDSLLKGHFILDR